MVTVLATKATGQMSSKPVVSLWSSLPATQAKSPHVPSYTDK